MLRYAGLCAETGRQRPLQHTALVGHPESAHCVSLPAHVLFVHAFLVQAWCPDG